MSNDLISRSSVIKGIDELMESPYANSLQFGAERKETMEMVKALCVIGEPTAYDVDKVVERLHNARGCDGSGDYAKGWDDAMKETKRIVKAG